MNRITGYSLFYLIILCSISCQKLPSTYSAIWSTFTYKIESTDCAVQNFAQPFPKCDGLFGNLTITNFIKANSDFLVSLITGFNVTHLYSGLDLFCKAANTYKSCQFDANKVCKANANWIKLYKVSKRDNPIYRVTLDLCRKGKLSKTYSSQRTKVNITSCLTNTFSEFTTGMTNYNAAIDRIKPLIERDPQVKDTVEYKRQLKVICAISGNFKRRLAIVGKLCSLPTVKLLLKTSQLLFLPEIKRACRLPNDNPKTYSRPYKVGNKDRVTSVIFGGFHKYQDGVPIVETCQYKNNDNITIFELDKLAIVCTVTVLTTNYTFIKSCSMTFYDDNHKIVDSLDYTSSGVMAATFKYNNGTSLGPLSSKGQGKPKLPITLKLFNSNKVRVIDQNTGVSFTIMKFTSKQKVNVYSIVIGLTKTALSSGTGEITRQCTNIVTIKGPRRAKRSTAPDTSGQANYDVSNLNDTAANTMAANIGVEFNRTTSTSICLLFCNQCPSLGYSIAMIIYIVIMGLIHFL